VQPGHASSVQASPTAPAALVPPAPVPLVALPQGSGTPADLASFAPYNPAPVTLDSAPLYERAAEDPGLAVTVLPHAAHLSLAADEGDLSLHVRVRDGSADVNVSGSMAPLFESKAPEMRTVLATHGFGLGSFASDQHGGGQHSQQSPEAPPAATQSSAARQPPVRASAAGDHDTVDEGRIHITA
jgi:hypothetical protein